MKKLLYCLSAMMVIFLAGSCQQELNPVTDGDTNVTFTVNAGDVATRADIADGTNVDILYWEIYKDVTAAPLGEGSVKKTSDKNFTVELKLLADQDYTIIFWAEVENGGHYNTEDLRNVEIVSYDDEMANDESRAAFFRVYEFSTENGKAINEDVYLYRPFSQINLGTTTYATSFTGGNVVVETTEMTVTNIATSFNTLDGVGEGEQEVTFQAAATPNGAADRTEAKLIVNDLSYYWIGMNYLIVNGESDNVTVDVTIKTQYGDVNHIVESVPVKENFRTNLLGNFLTTGATFNVIVDEEFQKPDYVVSEGWTHLGNYTYLVSKNAPESSLKDLLASADKAAREAATKAAGPEVTIELNGDVYWETDGGHGSSPLLPYDSPISKVIINGNDNTFTATGAGVGSIRLANGALLEFNDVNIVDESVSYAEDAWEFTYLEFAGNLAFNNCTFNSGATFQTESVEGEEVVVLNASFNTCRFITNEDSVYAVWVSDGATSFTGCTFEGTRGLKMHEAYGSEIDEVVIDGCTFGPLSKKPGVAIGDLNAKTAVTIKNSYFFGCQPGDQQNYIYESDTDVTTFSFTLENNEVRTDATTLLKELLDAAEEGDEIDVPAGKYTFPAKEIKAGVVLNCAEGTVFEGKSGVDIKGATVIGATFSNPSDAAAAGTVNGTFKDCVFEGANGLRWCNAGETVVFENCVFSGSLYGAHFDGGANDVLFKNCTFSGFNAFGGAITMLTFEGCKFVSNGKSGYNGANLWGKTKMINTEFTFDGTASTEWVDCISADKTYEFTGCTLNGGSIMNRDYIWSRNDGTDITIDGVTYEDYMTQTFISTAEELVAFAEEVNVNKNSFDGKTVYLVADIDLAGIDWEPIGQTGNCTFNGVFEGYDHTISNLSVDSEDQTGKYYSSGLFGWVESHTAGHGHIKNVKISGATVKGHHNCGALVGYITQETALIENCHVTGATITCTYANGDADGDKAGALIGNATVATPVKNCTAAKSTVSAGRDAGQVIGAGKEANVTGCSATEVAVSANGTGTGENIRNEVIGRLL